MPPSSPPLPSDEALPELATLLDPARAAALLRDRLSTAVDSVRVRYLELQPGRHAVVQLEATAGDGRFDAAAVAVPGQISVVRYPDDPALAHLRDPSGVSGALGIADVPPVRLAWVPGQRAALRVGGAVVKHYAEASAAAESFALMRRVYGTVPTAEPLAADAVRGVVAQRFVAGEPLERDDAAAFAALALRLLDRLADVPAEGLPVVDADALLRQGEGPVDLAGFARPQLADRLRRAQDRLRGTMPALATPVVAHGDFNVGQLLSYGDHLAVVDVDTLCVGERAFDVASYATNVVSGRVGDRDDLTAVLGALSDAGADPTAVAHLRWYVGATLLRRVDRAVRRLKRDWPERTDRLVEALEAAVAELG